MAPARIYLDQADWSHLEAGKDVEAEKRLRAAGEAGRALFMVSLDHLLETAAAETGWRTRLDFIRSFPGSCLYFTSSGDVLKHDAAILVAEADGAKPPPPLTLNAGRFTEVDYDGIVGGMPSLKGSRAMLKLLEDPQNLSRQASQLTAASKAPSGESWTGRDDLALTQALNRGDGDRVVSLIQRRNGGAVVPDHIQAQLRELAAAGAARWGAGAELGFVPPAEVSLDPVFISAAFPWLPMEVKSDGERLTRVRKQWVKAANEGRPLSACAAVYRAVETDKARKYESSEFIDALHVAYAPLVDVFTADKRTVSALRPLAISARILKNYRLADVADCVA